MRLGAAVSHCRRSRCVHPPARSTQNRLRDLIPWTLDLRDLTCLDDAPGEDLTFPAAVRSARNGI